MRGRTVAELLDSYAGMNVLVVDDNASNVALLEALLTSQGLTRVATEMDARRVPARLVAERPDLILLDLHMPYVSGFETLVRIQEHAAGGYLPVLVLTADTTLSARDRALRNGAQDFLSKPLDLLEATLRIGNLLRTKQLYASLRRIATPADKPAPETSQQVQDRVDSVLRNQALRSVYQPIVEINDLTVVGYEALSRFSDQGERGPQQWFADGFAAGRGVELEWLAASNALDILGSLPDAQFLALNMSAASIMRNAEQPFCDPQVCPRIVIELTEHVPVEDYTALHRALATMRAHGTRLAADDVGSGYAGFRHLLRLEPDIIKLDISLVGGIHRSSTQRALAKALIAFADDVGAIVIAEGVEQPDELLALRDLGLRWAQGFLLGLPGPTLTRPKPVPV